MQDAVYTRKLFILPLIIVKNIAVQKDTHEFEHTPFFSVNFNTQFLSVYLLGVWRFFAKMEMDILRVTLWKQPTLIYGF